MPDGAAGIVRVRETRQQCFGISLLRLDPRATPPTLCGTKRLPVSAFLTYMFPQCTSIRPISASSAEDKIPYTKP
jgi:hypothetical protein